MKVGESPRERAPLLLWITPAEDEQETRSAAVSPTRHPRKVASHGAQSTGDVYGQEGVFGSPGDAVAKVKGEGFGSLTCSGQYGMF